MIENPQFISQRLLEIDFRLPGKENHIPLLTEPYSIGKDQWDRYQSQLLHLVLAMQKAYNLFREDIGLDPIDDYSKYPFIWRFDFLTTPTSHCQHKHKMLELNATRPGGIWLLTKAHEAYKEVFGVDGSSLLTPSLDLIGNFFLRLSQRIKDGKGRVGLAYTPGYVAEIEMPKLCDLLNIWAKERGYPVSFISADRDSFYQNKDQILDPNGQPLTVLYENAAPQEQLNGQTKIFNFTENYGQTVIVNHPTIAGIDNKLVLAYLRNPRLKLSPQEATVVEYFLTKIFLIRSKEELDIFLGTNSKEDFFFKIGDGLRASSGKGVFDGRKDNLEEIEALIDQGNLFIAQRRIPPDNPWYLASRLEKGKIFEENVFIDFNPYVFSDGQETTVNGVLVRAKNEHPINVSQGGALACARVI